MPENQNGKITTFSGIQPTGNLHLGNYLGAIRNWVLLQNEGLGSFGIKTNQKLLNIFCIVDLHAITTIRDPKFLKENSLKTAALLLACGLDPNKSIIFIQSEVLEHQALAWILDCNISMGEMNRMTQFKDKSEQNPQNINVGLFNYPALMAADILLYNANFVPVGADQKQHLELTRNVAKRFNTNFGEKENYPFIIPDPLIIESSAKIMGLDNPEIKMSKSIKNQNHAIFLLDNKDEIIRKIKRAQTDSFGVIEFSDSSERKGLRNLLEIYKTLSQKDNFEIQGHFKDKGYGALKSDLSELLINHLMPISQKYEALLKDRAFVENCLEEGAKKAKQIASQNYRKIANLVGLKN